MAVDDKALSVTKACCSVSGMAFSNIAVQFERIVMFPQRVRQLGLDLNALQGAAIFPLLIVAPLYCS